MTNVNAPIVDGNISNHGCNESEDLLHNLITDANDSTMDETITSTLFINTIHNNYAS